MSRNIVQINEIRRFEKSDQKTKTKTKEIFKLRSFAHEVKSSLKKLTSDSFGIQSLNTSFELRGHTLISHYKDVI